MPKESEAKPVIQPDVIPTQHSQAAVPPPAAFTNDFVDEPVVQHDIIVKPPDEQLYSNVNKNVEQATTTVKVVEPIDEKINVPQSPVPQSPVPQSPIKEKVPVHEPIEHIDPIYQNQEDLTEYIEDTGVKAVKYLDFRAAFMIRLIYWFSIYFKRLQCMIIRLQPMMRFHLIRTI